MKKCTIFFKIIISDMLSLYVNRMYNGKCE